MACSHCDICKYRFIQTFFLKCERVTAAVSWNKWKRTGLRLSNFAIHSHCDPLHPFIPILKMVQTTIVNVIGMTGNITIPLLAVACHWIRQPFASSKCSSVWKRSLTLLLVEYTDPWTLLPHNLTIVGEFVSLPSWILKYWVIILAITVYKKTILISKIVFSNILKVINILSLHFKKSFLFCYLNV